MAHLTLSVCAFLLAASVHEASASRIRAVDEEIADLVADQTQAEPNAAGLEPNQYILAIHNPIFKAPQKARDKALKQGPYYGSLFCSSLSEDGKKYGQGFWLELDAHLNTRTLCVKVTCPSSGKSQDIGYEFLPDCEAAESVVAIQSGSHASVPHVNGLRLVEVTDLFQVRKGNKFHYMWNPFARHRAPEAKDHGIVDFDMLTKHAHGYSQPHVGTTGTLFAHLPKSRGWAVNSPGVCATVNDAPYLKDVDVSTPQLYQQCVAELSAEAVVCKAETSKNIKDGLKWYKSQRETSKIASCEHYLKSDLLDSIFGTSEKKKCLGQITSRLQSTLENCDSNVKCSEGLTKLSCSREAALPVPPA